MVDRTRSIRRERELWSENRSDDEAGSDRFAPCRRRHTPSKGVPGAPRRIRSFATCGLAQTLAANGEAQRRRRSQSFTLRIDRHTMGLTWFGLPDHQGRRLHALWPLSDRSTALLTIDENQRQAATANLVWHWPLFWKAG